MIVDSCETAFSVGFLSYIKDTHTTYSKNCYELPNIDDVLDKDLLKKFVKYVDIINEFGVTSMCLNNSSLICEISEVIKDFKNFNDDYKRAFIRGLYEYNNIFENSNDIYIKKNDLIKDNYQDYMDYVNIPYIVDDENRILIKFGCNSNDFLGFL